MSVTVEVLPTTGVQRDRIESAIDAARQHSAPVLLTSTEPLPFIPDPLTFLAASSDALGDGMLWSQAGKTTFAGAGIAHEIVADGPGRFGEVTSALRDLNQRIAGDEASNRFPILGGFAFSDHRAESPRWRGFPGARLVVPKVLLQIERDRALLRVTQPISGIESAAAIGAERAELFARARAWAAAEPIAGSTRQILSAESVPDRVAWESAVATAVAIIRQGTIDKVVLAREERVRTDGPFSAVTTLANLRAANSGATLFAVQAEGAWFIGATPERLVRLDRGRVDVSCLAGSITIGASLEERQRLAARLLASEKDREEHEIVVRSTMAALAEVCEDVSRAPNTPRVVPARSVQHLESGLTGTLPSAGHVLDLVERLHPTPAVGGYPRDRALSIMRELEETERGWYAGPIGWTDLEGSGEFAVAIRSALVAGAAASLYAGCGIVAGSRPSEEFVETRLKLEPMLAALGAR